jgi:hypothetical protein
MVNHNPSNGRFPQFTIRVRTSAVGNSPLILDESSDHGLGQRYHHLDVPGPGIFRDRALLFRKIVPLGDQLLARRYVV